MCLVRKMYTCTYYTHMCKCFLLRGSSSVELGTHVCVYVHIYIFLTNGILVSKNIIYFLVHATSQLICACFFSIDMCLPPLCRYVPICM